MLKKFVNGVEFFTQIAYYSVYGNENSNRKSRRRKIPCKVIRHINAGSLPVGREHPSRQVLATESFKTSLVQKVKVLGARLGLADPLAKTRNHPARLVPPIS